MGALVGALIPDIFRAGTFALDISDEGVLACLRGFPAMFSPIGKTLLRPAQPGTPSEIPIVMIILQTIL
jgi:hypothetical protein